MAMKPVRLFAFFITLLSLAGLAFGKASRTTQRDAIAYIVDQVQLMAGTASLAAVLRQGARTFRTSERQLRRWYKHYLFYGELPFDTSREWKRLLRRSTGAWQGGRHFRPRHVEALRKILERNPEYYLDEFVHDLYIETGTLFHPSTVWRALHDKLGHSLKTCAAVARERNERLRHEYKVALALFVFDPCQVIFCDETHKDKNAARRRRAWGVRNEDLVLKKWFQDTVRYTCLAACNINGFVVEACDTVRRDNISDEGAAGTVDSDRFYEWVETHLAPQLGDCEKGEKNSVAVMDNASTHFDRRIKRLIEKKKNARLLYTAPYCPDLNPIEKMFSVYKACLRRHGQLEGHQADWQDLHYGALLSVTPDIAAKHFRKCGVPGMEN